MSGTTMSSRDFYQKTNVATRAALDGPVVVTVRGEPTHVLMTYKHYQELNGGRRNIIEMLSMPDGDDISFEIPKLEMKIQSVDFT